MLSIINWPFMLSAIMLNVIMLSVMAPIGLYHPLDGVGNPKYKLLHFLTTKLFCKEKKALAFNRDRCCHLALCLRLIHFHLLILFRILEEQKNSHILENVFFFVCLCGSQAEAQNTESLNRLYSIRRLL